MQHILTNAKLAAATFIAGASASPVTGTLFDIDMWKVALVSGCTALWQFIAKWAIDVQKAARQNGHQAEAGNE
jgi:hypothetical protein